MLNPVLRLAFRVPLPDPGDALLETKGRRTGQPRLTSVCDGADGNIFWLLSQRGRDADWSRNIEANPCVRVKVRTARVGWRGGTAHILDDDDARQPALPWECCEPREPRESCVPGTVLQLFVNCRLTVNGEHGANATLPVAQGTSLGPEPEPKPLRSSTPFTPPPTGRIRSGPVPSGPV